MIKDYFSVLMLPGVSGDSKLVLEINKLLKNCDLADEYPLGDGLQKTVSDLMNAGLTQTAAAFLENAINSGVSMNIELVNLVLKRLAAAGSWLPHNGLLTTAIYKLHPERARAAIPFMLDKLDHVNTERLLEIVEMEQPAPNLEVEKICFEIARMNYSSVERILGERQDLLDRLLENQFFRKWLYVLSGQCDLSFAEQVYHRLLTINLDQFTLADNLAEFLKICWARGWENLVKELLTRFCEPLESSILKSHQVFSRVYVFSCDRLAVKTALRSQICETTDPIFSAPELHAIALKGRALTHGVQSVLESDVGPVMLSSKRYLEIPLIVYGEKYVQTLKKFFLLSALSEREFRNLALKYNATISICTTPSSVDAVRQTLAPLQDLGFELRFDKPFILPADEIPHKRMWFVLNALHRVEGQRGIYLMLCPDSVFGSGFEALIDKCPEGGGAGGNLVRASWSAMMRSEASGELKRLLSLKHRKNEAIVRTSVERWHHYSHRLFFENISPNYQTRVASGVRYNSWQGVPNIIKPDHGFTERLLQRAVYRYSVVYGDHIATPFDHELVGDLQREGKLYMTSSYREFVFVEMAADAGYSNLWKFQLPLGHFEPRLFGECFPT